MAASGTTIYEQDMSIREFFDRDYMIGSVGDSIL